MREVAEAFGLRFVEVPDLERQAIYVHAHGIVLLRDGLEDDQVDTCAAWALEEAAATVGAFGGSDA